jgi:nitroreductase
MPPLKTILPILGEPLDPKPSPDTLRLLAQRRSPSALSLGGDAMDDETIKSLLSIALRVPDHGKLTPWRLIIFKGEAKKNLILKLSPLADTHNDPQKAQKGLQKLALPPVMIMVISSPKGHDQNPPPKPIWEQELSSGALCQNIMIAAAALGIGANWISEWVSYDTRALSLFGLKKHEKIAGLIMLGSVSAPVPERERPLFEDVVSIA